MSPPGVLQNLASALPTPSICADAQGRCIYANPAWCALTGFSPEACAGTGWAASIHPRDREQVLTAWADFARSASPLWVRFRLRCASGRQRWIRLSATHLPPGSPAAIFAQAEDQTELHNAQIAHSLYERTLELVDEVAPVGQWRIWAAGRSFWASQSVHELLGTSGAATGGTLDDWLDRHLPADQPAARAHFELALAEGAPIEYEANLSGPQGRTVTVSVRGRADWDLDGQVMALFGVVRERAPVRVSSSRRAMVAAVPPLHGGD